MRCRSWSTLVDGVVTSSGWDCWWEEGSGGDGGGVGGEPPSGGGGGGVGFYSVPRDPNNPETATCSSDSEGRYLSARQDFLKWKASTRPTQLRGEGEVLKIPYLGGGDERYIWVPGTIASPTAPATSMLARVPGSLNCPYAHSR